MEASDDPARQLLVLVVQVFGTLIEQTSSSLVSSRSVIEYEVVEKCPNSDDIRD